MSQLTVQYDVVDSTMKGFNLFSNSLITIKGFDSSGQQVNVNFTGDNDSYFNLNMQISATGMKGLSIMNSTGMPAYRLRCVYFDESRSLWLENGMSISNYDPQSGMMSC